jgi:hypothetical protein
MLFTSEVNYSMRTVKPLALFHNVIIYPSIRNLSRGIRPDRFFRNRTVRAAPLRKSLSPRNCSCSTPPLSSLFSSPSNDTSRKTVNDIRIFNKQKSFQCDIMFYSTGLIKSNSQFLLLLLSIHIDELGIFILNYINYKNIDSQKVKLTCPHRF